MFGVSQELFTGGDYVDGAFDAKKFKEDVLLRLQPLYGLDIVSIAKKLGVYATGKDSVRSVMDAAMGTTKDEFRRANICPKIYVLYPNAPSAAQHMSFKAFRIQNVKYCDWEYSWLRNLVTENEFLFLVFENTSDSPRRRNDVNIIFKEAFYWKMPQEDIDEVKRVYEKAQDVIRSGIEVRKVHTADGKVIKSNNLPSPLENRVCHVRPHGNPDSPEVLDGMETINRQSFWLNAEYVTGVIRAHTTNSLFAKQL